MPFVSLPSFPQGPISEVYLPEIARQVLQGMAYLHRQHVVHRDIKPCNLLINKQGQVLTDMGKSK